MADLLDVVCDVYCDFATLPFGIQGNVWYLIVSIPDRCFLSYFVHNERIVSSKYMINGMILLLK